MVAMNRLHIIFFAVITLIFSSCHNAQTSPAGSGSPDSAANNGIVPPSAAPGNATNSSLADTVYKSGDTVKSRKDSVRK
jgi:hypothetical protein